MELVSRVIALQGVQYEVMYDGTAAGFAARVKGTPDQLISIDTASALFSINRYYDLIRDIDPSKMTDAAEEMLTATKGVAAQMATAAVLSQSSAALFNLAGGGGLTVAAINLIQGKPVDPTGVAKVLSVASDLVSFAGGITSIVAQKGAENAAIAMVANSIELAAAQADAYKADLDSILENGVINAETVLSALQRSKLISGLVPTAISNLKELAVGGDPDWFESTKTDRFFGAVSTLLNDFGLAVTSEAVSGGIRILDHTPAATPLSLLNSIVELAGNVTAISTSANRLELATALLDYYQPRLPEIDPSLFVENLLAVSGTNTTPGYQTIWDVGGSTFDDAITLNVHGPSTKIFGTLSASDTMDMYVFDAPGGTSFTFSSGIAGVRLFDSNGDRVTLSYSTDRWTSSQLTQGSYFLELTHRLRSVENYTLDIEQRVGTWVATDDHASGATDLGTLGTTTLVADDDLQGSEGFDGSDHYKVTLTETTDLQAIVSGPNGVVRIAIYPEGQTKSGYLGQWLAAGDLFHGTVTGHVELPPGTYVIEVIGNGPQFDYHFEVSGQVTAETAVQTHNSGTLLTGDQNDNVEMHGGILNTEGGDDYVLMRRGDLDAGSGDDTIHILGSGVSSGHIDGNSGSDTLLIENINGLSLFGIDADGDKVSYGVDVASIKAAIAATVEYGVQFSGRYYTPVTFQSIEGIVITNVSDVGTIIYTDALSHLSVSGYVNFYADWSARTDAVVMDARSNDYQEVFSGFSLGNSLRTIRIISGSGDDIISGNGSVWSGDGDDVLDVTGTIDAGAGNDTVTGFSGTADLGSGDDFIDIQGSAVVDGGAGHDTAVYDLLGVAGSYFSTAGLGAEIRDENGDWVRISGAASDRLDLLTQNEEWRALNFKGGNASFENFEDIHLGGTNRGTVFGGSSSGNDYFYAFEGVTSVNGYGATDTLYADWSDETQAFDFNIMDHSTSVLVNGFTIAEIEKLHVRTGSGDDRVTLNGSIWSGAGDDIISMGEGSAYLGAGDDLFRTVSGGGIYSSFDVDLGDGDDEAFTVIGYGNYDGGNGIDTLHVSVQRWRYLDDTETEIIPRTFGEIETMLAEYATGTEISAQTYAGRNIWRGQTFTNFERVDQAGTIEDDILIDFGNGSMLDGGAGRDTLFADWSTETGPIVWDNRTDGETFYTPSEGSVRNIEKLWLQSGAGDDQFWIDYGGHNLRTGGGNDFVSLTQDFYGPGSTINTEEGDDIVVVIYARSSNYFNLGTGNDLLVSAGGVTLADGEGGTDHLVINKFSRIQFVLNYGETDEQRIQRGASVTDVDLLIEASRTGAQIRIDNSSATWGTFTNFEQVSQFSLGDSLLVDFGGNSILSADASSSDRNDFHLGDGNDLAQGARGEDSYFIRNGFGQDIIEDTSDSNMVDFVQSASSELSFERDGFNLGVSHTDGSYLLIRDYFISATQGRNWTFKASGADITIDMLTIPGAVITPVGGQGTRTETTAHSEPDPVQLLGDKNANALSGTTTADHMKGFASGDVMQGRGGNDKIFGGAGDDWLLGDKGNDSLFGGDGDDSIEGSQGNDTLEGGLGNDTLSGGSGADSINGGDGRDTAIWTIYSRITVDLEAGTASDGDTLTRIENVIGTSGNDILLGDFAYNKLEAMEGDDTLDGRAGNDTLDGGAGNDDITGGDGNDLLIGGDGNDTLYGGNGNDTLIAGAGADILIGGLSYDTADFSNQGGMEVDLEAGTTSDGDTLSQIENVIGSTLGSDVLGGDANSNKLLGLGGNDTLNGRAGNDTLDGGDGDDQLNGGLHDDHISGGAGQDIAIFDIASGDVLFRSGINGIKLISAAGFDFVANDVETFRFTDGLFSYAQIEARINQLPSGTVSIIGAATEDESLQADISLLSDADGLGDFSYQWLRDGLEIPDANLSSYTLSQNDVGSVFSVTVNYIDGAGVVESVTSSTTSAVSNVNDTPIGNIVITGSITEGGTLSADASSLSDADGLGTFSYQWLRDGAAISGATSSGYELSRADVGGKISVQVNYTDGYGYDESVTSHTTSKVADPFIGDGTNNTIIGDGRANIIRGRGGDDILSGKGRGDTIYGDKGNDTLRGDAGNDVLVGGEGDDLLQGGSGGDQADGGTGNDTLQGNAGKDILKGGKGADLIQGGGGADVADGGAGHDTIEGGGGNDTLQGQAGRDILDGGKGKDILTGGGGSDKFVFKLGYGKDTIKDFQDDKDTIRLDTDLWSGSLNKQQVINKFARVDGNDIVFDFGKHELTLKGFSDLTELKDDISFI